MTLFGQAIGVGLWESGAPGRAAVSVPDGVFKPYPGVSTAILFFTKTNSGGTDQGWFYDMPADGYRLDDKPQTLLVEAKLGLQPSQNMCKQL